MATRRMLSKSVSTSKKLSRVSDGAALLWTWTIPHCDDLGHMDGSLQMIRAIVIPLRAKTDEELQNLVDELVKNDLWKMYDIEDERYLEICNWESHQTFKNDRELQVEFPLPPWNPKGSTRNPVGKFVRLREGKVSKGKGREGNAYAEDFESFWKVYPKKVGKPKASVQWSKLPEADRSAVMADIPKRLSDDKWIAGFVKDPERYLSLRQWEDDIIRPKKYSLSPPPKAYSKPDEYYEDRRTPEEKARAAELLRSLKPKTL